MHVLDFTRFSAGFLALNNCVLITNSSSPGCESMAWMLIVSIKLSDADKTHSMALFVAVFEVIASDTTISCLAAFDDLSGAAIWIKSPRPFGSARPKKG